MNQSINLKTISLAVRNSIRAATAKGGFLVVAVALTLFALSPAAQAQLPSPTPDGGYPSDNTAEGTNALLSLTSGTDNTAIGFEALQSTTTDSRNTATGSQALLITTPMTPITRPLTTLRSVLVHSLTTQSAATTPPAVPVHS